MHKYLIGLLAAASATAAPAAVVNLDLGNPSGPLNADHTYSTSVGNVVASGYNSDNSDADLYGKNLGGDEQGLGLASEPNVPSGDPSGQNEIYYHSYVQLDVSDILANTSAATFFMGSTTAGEGWIVYGSNTDACDPFLGCLDAALITSGSDEGVSHDLTGWGTYNYYNFFSTGTNGQAPGNVLLGGLTLTESVPEPATWAMMLLGFGAMGVAFRRRRRTAQVLTQIA